MLKLITAVISVCLLDNPNQCSQTTLRIEPSACHLPSYKGEIQLYGNKQKVILKIKCS